MKTDVESQRRFERRKPGQGLGLDLKGKAGAARLAEARRRRTRAHLAQEAHVEMDRLTTRVQFLLRKHARLPMGNGKRKTYAEAVRCSALSLLIQHTLDGKALQKLPAPGPTRYEARAVRLLLELVSA